MRMHPVCIIVESVIKIDKRGKEGESGDESPGSARNVFDKRAHADNDFFRSLQVAFTQLMRMALPEEGIDCNKRQ